MNQTGINDLRGRRSTADLEPDWLQTTWTSAVSSFFMKKSHLQFGLLSQGAPEWVIRPQNTFISRNNVKTVQQRHKEQISSEEGQTQVASWLTFSEKCQYLGLFA